MQVSISFKYTAEEDGYEGMSEHVHEDVFSLDQLAMLFGDAVRGAGWSYVCNVGFEKDDGSMVFGDT